MSTPNGHRPVSEPGDWFREQEKASIHQARRPQVQRASDFLGPGIAAYAVELADWNSDAALFNGLWVATDALNGPGVGLWFGLSIGQPEGSVMQLAASPAVAGGGTLQIRLVETNGVGVRTFHPWGPVA